MYRAPVEDIAFALNDIAGLSAAIDAGVFPDLSADLVEAILSEAGRFAGEEVAPLARIGDTQGARLADAAVTMPDGWKDLYHRWRAGGWNALSAPEEFGGQR
jgi:alkylation response protein AidB-like acyl-CoA dehydrogenase